MHNAMPWPRPTVEDQRISMRRRAEYASTHRGSGVASSSNCSTEDADGAAANKRSKEQPSGGGNIAVTPAKVIGTIMAVFFIMLIISGNNEWPPKKRRLRQPPFIPGQIIIPSKEDGIARQRERGNANLVLHEGEKERERQAYARAIQQPAVLLSRDPQGVQVTTDVGGNLGSPSVLNQVVPGDDWLKDRWQAASDMHGTEIKGQHWVELDFTQMRKQGVAFWPAYAILDWETAVSTDYAISGRRRLEDDGDAWHVLFDSKKHAYDTTTSGKSPGVKKEMPLHYIHNATLRQQFSLEAVKSGMHEEPNLIDAIRIVIRSSDHGWGVSLWQVDIYGWKGEEIL